VSGNSFEGEFCWAAVTNRAVKHNKPATDTRIPANVVNFSVLKSISKFTSESPPSPRRNPAVVVQEPVSKLYFSLGELSCEAAGAPLSWAAFNLLKMDSCSAV